MSERYPAAAVDKAIDALELAYSYLRDSDKPLIEEVILDAIDRLRRARELHEEQVRESARPMNPERGDDSASPKGGRPGVGPSDRELTEHNQEGGA